MTTDATAVIICAKCGQPHQGWHRSFVCPDCEDLNAVHRAVEREESRKRFVETVQRAPSVPRASSEQYERWAAAWADRNPLS